MATRQFSTVATAQIEFQLINHKDYGIIGRLYIPVSLRNTGKVTGKLIYDSDRPGRNCNYNKSRTIEFIGSVAEYRRCLREYASSNMAVNRVRTLNLMEQLAVEIKGQALPIVPVEPKQEDVTDSLTDREILNHISTLDEMSSDGDLDASDMDELYKRIDQLTVAENNVPKISIVELEDDKDLKYSYSASPVVFLEVLGQMSLRELKATAKEQGLKGISKLKKAQLIDLLFAYL